MSGRAAAAFAASCIGPAVPPAPGKPAPPKSLRCGRRPFRGLTPGGATERLLWRGPWPLDTSGCEVKRHG